MIRILRHPQELERSSRVRGGRLLVTRYLILDLHGSARDRGPARIGYRSDNRPGVAYPLRE